MSFFQDLFSGEQTFSLEIAHATERFNKTFNIKTSKYRKKINGTDWEFPNKSLELSWKWFVIDALIVALSKNGPSKSECMFCLTTYTLKHVAFTLWVERWNSRRSWIVFVFRRKCYSQYVFINRRIDFVCYWIVGDWICWHRQTHINIHIVKLMNIFYCVFSEFIFICMWTRFFR